MTYIELPDHGQRDVSFYLSMEEYVAHHVDAADCFFMWQVEPSVIFGRNQVAEAEVNLDYCRRHGIRTFRRKSGGGCVYADMGNVMMSYVTRGESVGFTYNKYVTTLLLAFRRIGINATASGRNDILVDGSKVSGSAFYQTHGHSIVHGTLLYDTDMDNMTSAITPPSDKLQSKGVGSVRSRITLLKDHTDLSLGQLKDALRRQLCDGSVTLTPADIRSIEAIEAEYMSANFIFGKNPPYTVARKQRIEGVGTVEARIDLRGNTIRNVCFKGDFLPGEVPIERLENALAGAELTPARLTMALAGGEAAAIRGMQTEALISLLTNKT